MIDVIGLIFQPAVRDAEGEVIAPAFALDGWHVNTTPVVMAIRPELDPFVVTPLALRRVWAGDDPANPALTVALRFSDEAEALAYFPAV